MFKEIRQIGMGELESFKINFENWIDNISLVKVYNAMEIFLWQAIWWKDFQTFKNPSYDKKSMDSIVNAIKKILTAEKIRVDTKNNKHLIAYLKYCSNDVKTFLNQPAICHKNNTWEEFFEMFSVIRNVVAHQGGIVSKDIKNELQSKSRDTFNTYFDFEKSELDTGSLVLKTKNISNFISRVNNFSLNLIKFLFSEENLDFYED